MSDHVQADQITMTWNLLVQPGRVHEFRAPKCGKYKTVSGYFNVAEDLAAAVEWWNGKANLYLTLNPVNPALLARAANQAKPYAENTTADAEIVSRRWLPVDLDAKRPSGISSSREEHDLALTRAVIVREFLCRYNVPSILADSGNGGHLLIPIDLPNDAPSRVLVEGVLKALGLLFDDADVQVDTTCANAARIWKIYGTLACKGENMPDRPHRYASIIEIPTDLSPVSPDRLQQIANLIPKPESPVTGRATRDGKGRQFDLLPFLSANGLRVVASAPIQGRMRHRLEACPFNADHRAPDAAVFEGADGMIGFKCMHNSCADKGWTAVRELFEPEYRQKRAQYDEINEKSPVYQGNNSLNSFISSGVSKNIRNVESLPDPLDDAALIGPAGEFVRMIEPHTESDPVAILVQFLLAFGSVIGRNAFADVEASQHYTNEFAVLVGESAKARKGTSASWVRRLFEWAEPDWATHRMHSGLSSGEGVIWAVRDPLMKMHPIKEKGKGVVGYEEVLDDPGETDKRLLIVEEEFARALIVMNRESNILSTILRQSWDSGKLRVMTKQPYKATDAHISIIGHITRDELRRLMTDTAQVNGFANRFLWFMVKRSKLLPEGGTLQIEALMPIQERIRQAVEFGKQTRCIKRDAEARKAWHMVYPELTAAAPGLMGSVTSRADPHVLRLSILYAVLDMSEEVKLKHLMAALALWEYSEQSARYIFGDALGDPVADSILKELRNSPEGMTRTDLNNLFGRNQKAERIVQCLTLLQDLGMASSEQVPTNGRPVELWKAVGGLAA